MADLPPEVTRINALTTNARTTWFALLGVLVFVGITLMGVEHIDFYGVNRATKLPLVDVEVPTRLFFIAAPILTFAIYGYFHLYLIRLWDALGAAGPFVRREPLGNAIAPWLVSDAALHLRNRKRKDKCTTPRSLEGAAMLLNVALAWGFGLAVLLALWWTSMAARDVLMTGLAGLMLIGAGWVGLASWLVMRRRMRGLGVTDKRPIWAWAALGLGGTVAIACVGVVSIERTSEALGLYQHAAKAEETIGSWLRGTETDDTADNGSSGGSFSLPEDLLSATYLRLGPVNLVGEALVEKPDDWLPYDIARSDFRAKWCAREGIKDCQALSADQAQAFQSEWTTRRSAQIDALGKPEINPINPTQYAQMNEIERAITSNAALDLRQADLRDAFLPGMNLVAVDLTMAQLSGAQMEGANLRDAQMDRANLNGAQIEGANIYSARMKGASLIGAQMDRANLSFAEMEVANLSFAQMEGADLSFAEMGGATLLLAEMKGANLSGSRMQGAYITFAEMEGANLSFTRVFGFNNRLSLLSRTNLNASLNTAGALRFVDMTHALWDAETDFRDAFMDATVIRTEAFETRMGNPCQWVHETLNDQEFFSVWRWWLEEKIGQPGLALPNDLRNTPHPTPERLAELGLTDCEPNQPFGPMPATD